MSRARAEEWRFKRGHGQGAGDFCQDWHVCFNPIGSALCKDMPFYVKKYTLNLQINSYAEACTL